MAVKKTAKKEESATPTKSAAKDSAKTTSPKKSAAPKAGANSASPKAAKPKAAPIKLTESQKALLDKVHGSGEGGYSPEKKIEERSLQALQERKLIKKGAKDKASGKTPYMVSATGKKHVESNSGGASPQA